MLAAGVFGLDDLAWIIPSAAAVAGIGMQAAQGTPETPKAGMPGVEIQPLRSPQPAGSPFMNRNQIQMRESAARRMIGG